MQELWPKSCYLAMASLGSTLKVPMCLARNGHTYQIHITICAEEVIIDDKKDQMF